MSKKILKYSFVFAVALLLWGCIKNYEPPPLKAANNYLVVDGFINTNPGAVTTITLTRTRSLSDTSYTNSVEEGAAITIKSGSGASFALFAMGYGVYKSAPLNLNAGETYQLQIITANGRQYSSDFVQPKQTQPIDSVSWKQDADTKDVSIFVSTHDASSSSRYYKWDYTETWQYYAQLEASWGVANGYIFLHDANTQTDSCWITRLSTDILLGNSTALKEDVISNAKIATIIKDDEKIGVRYSINVRQFAITPEAYNYWQIIEKNSQDRGGLFDLQPAQLNGNIHAVTDPSEPVVGFVSAASVTESRIFIRNKELEDWAFNPISGGACPSTIISVNPIDFRIWDYPDNTYGPWYFITGGGLAITKNSCLDCRSHGGINVRPLFW